MTWLRSLLFNLLYYTWTPGLGLISVPRLLSEDGARNVIKLWAWGGVNLLKICCNVPWEVRGREHINEAPCIYAVKHQSAWETMGLWLILPQIAFVIKKELAMTPIIGWYLRRSRQIAVDRDAGLSALKKMLAEAREQMTSGRSIIIYPEGTRTTPGEDATYHPGVAMLYEKLGVPVVPVALNTGLFWGRRAFLMRPGKIVVEFLPPIAPGMKAREFLGTLKDTIETASRKLI